MKTILRKISSFIIIILFFLSSLLNSVIYSSEKNNGKELNDSAKGESGFEKFYFQVSSEDEGDAKLRDMLIDECPIISEENINDIISKKEVNKFRIDSMGTVEIYENYYVPKNYLDTNPKILWELNIPEFRSRVYQFYNNDTILLTTWNNVVGAPASKTYTGYYEAFRLRNYPSWKDPEKPESQPTPPGPGNPLGLFVVHYDENSLRYFHGTNKNNLLNNDFRALSHGCVRNDNGNIEKMKRFIIKKIVKSNDLSFWVDSKKSMIYEMKEEDRFPVKIMYKLYNVDKDEKGAYVEFFKDCYSYTKNAKLSKFDNPDLIIVPTVDNILYEYSKEIKNNKISDEQLIPVFQKLITDHTYNKKYYLSEYFPGIGD